MKKYLEPSIEIRQFEVNMDVIVKSKPRLPTETDEMPI